MTCHLIFVFAFAHQLDDPIILGPCILGISLCVPNVLLKMPLQFVFMIGTRNSVVLRINFDFD